MQPKTFRETRIAYHGRAVPERTKGTPLGTHRGVQGEVFSRKAQLIKLLVGELGG